MTETLYNDPRLDKLKRYAKLLDSQFVIPGTNFRFGIDPLLSLIPGLGTYSGLITGFIFILMTLRVGAQGKVLVKMFINVIMDFLIGLVPVLGNAYDFVYKANRRNLQLVEEHYLHGMHQGSGVGLLLLILSIMAILMVMLIALAYFALKFLVKILESPSPMPF